MKVTDIRDTMVLDLAHYSMQFSDTTKQKRHDALEIFSHNYDAITGTESGEANTRRELRVAAHNAGYTYHVNRSNWVSIKKSLIKPKSYRKGHEVFVDNDKVIGPGHDLHVTWAGCYIPRIGRVSFLSSHYATRGRPVKDPEFSKNLGANKILARGIGDMAAKLGAGNALVFYGGDQNIIDKDHDTFFGENLTTAWDELKKYQNTGHGNIDVIASYDRDKRVKAKYIRALSDKKQFMYTDHFPVEAGFEIRLLPQK